MGEVDLFWSMCFIWLDINNFSRHLLWRKVQIEKIKFEKIFESIKLFRLYKILLNLWAWHNLRLYKGKVLPILIHIIKFWKIIQKIYVPYKTCVILTCSCRLLLNYYEFLRGPFLIFAEILFDKIFETLKSSAQFQE